jgi:hypothetical protein
MTSFAKLKGILNELFKGSIKTLVAFSFLPHQAWINGNAIISALYRQHLSHKNMLQWTVSSSFSKQDNQAGNLQLVVIAFLSAVAILLLMFFSNRGLNT